MRDALPNASFIGFTGTPIELTDRNTRAVFGDHIHIYDVEQAVKDKATVPIYYESRLVKLELKEKDIIIDEEFEEATEGEEVENKEKLKTKWARLEAVVGSENRIKQIAEDIVDHFEKRIEVMNGKGMIVCMSRRICIELYKEIIRLRPQWHNDDDKKGFIKVIMTGSATDPVEWQEHIRNKQRRWEIGERMKDFSDPLKLVIVRDMWLTGFDVPSLHTMYVDKPMRGHGLMQAIARVNRVFKDKPGGLVVDYLGFAYDLRKALSEYTKSGGKGEPTFDKEKAVAIMIEKYEIVSRLFYGFDYRKAYKMKTFEYLKVVNDAVAHIMELEDGKNRLLLHVTELSKAFALSVPHPETKKIRDDVGFFQDVRARLSKFDSDEKGKSKLDSDSAIRQILSKAITSNNVVDIFDAAGVKKPDISILSESFLTEVRSMPHKNLAFELLKKLLNEEIKLRSRKNLIKSRSFAKMVEEAIRKYQNKTIETAKIIEELITIARNLREDSERGKKLNLNEDEIAFYDALSDNDSAKKVLGDEKLSIIAHELVKLIRNNVTIDWTIRASVQARIRLMVKKILRKYGYPPDLQKKATELVLEQASVIAKDWTESGIKQKQETILEDINVIKDIDYDLKYKKFLPVYSLMAAAGKFRNNEAIEEQGWVKIEGRKLNKDMFVAKVVGHSMEPLISADSYCIFKTNVTGTRQGKIVLAQHRAISDPELGGSFTIKRYKSDKKYNSDGTWYHTQIMLEPINKDYETIVLPEGEEEAFTIIAEFIDLLK